MPARAARRLTICRTWLADSGPLASVQNSFYRLLIPSLARSASQSWTTATALSSIATVRL
jgi:hypothetical protein